MIRLTAIILSAIMLVGEFQPTVAKDVDNYVSELPGSLMPSIGQTGRITLPDRVRAFPYVTESASLNLLESETFQDWVNDMWTNSSRRRHLYDGEDRRVATAYESWHLIAWSEHTRDTIYWNDSPSRTDSTVTTQTDGQTWSNTIKTAFGYDHLGRLETILYLLWTANEWENWQQYLYTHDPLDRVDSTFFSIWNNQQLENSKLTTYSYNADGAQAEAQFLIWISEAWSKFLKSTYQYDGSLKLTELLTLEWRNDQWNNNSRQTYTYNTSQSTETMLLELWLNGAWVENTQITVFYDSFQQISEVLWQRKEADEWINSQRWLRKYSVVTGVGASASNRPAGFSLNQNIPNPFNPATIIEYSLARKSYVELTVYNLLGQEIRKLVDEVKSAGVYSIKWNGRDNSGSSVASGLYLYRLRTGSGSTTKKMILIR